MKQNHTNTATAYFAVEVIKIHGQLVQAAIQQGTEMPQYLCCLGAGAESQIQEADCFLVTDDKERLWYCREVEPADPAAPNYAEQFFRMGFLAHKIGISEAGKMFHGNAVDEDDLKDQLTAEK